MEPKNYINLPVGQDFVTVATENTPNFLLNFIKISTTILGIIAVIGAIQDQNYYTLIFSATIILLGTTIITGLYNGFNYSSN